MKGKWLAISMVVAALSFSTFDAAYQYRRLPPRVASHFDSHGRPDGWSTKLQFVSAAAATYALVTVLLVPLSLIAYIAPATLVQLPNKEYWLAPERESQTRRGIALWGVWFTAATLWLLALLFHQAMVANLRQPPQLEWFWSLLGGYMAIVSYLVIQLILRFRRMPRDPR